MKIITDKEMYKQELLSLIQSEYIREVEKICKTHKMSDSDTDESTSNTEETESSIKRIRDITLDSKKITIDSYIVSAIHEMDATEGCYKTLLDMCKQHTLFSILSEAILKLEDENYTYTKKVTETTELIKSAAILYRVVFGNKATGGDE